MTNTASLLGWRDIQINLDSNIKWLEIVNAYVKIDQEKFGLQAGPTINKDRKGTLNLQIKNPKKISENLQKNLKKPKKEPKKT
jgi:hypothetical protein